MFQVAPQGKANDVHQAQMPRQLGPRLQRRSPARRSTRRWQCSVGPSTDGTYTEPPRDRRRFSQPTNGVP